MVSDYPGAIRFGLFLVGFRFFDARDKNLFAIVIAASCADAVWQAISAAVGAGAKIRFADCVVRTAVASARV
jgi:hypothetical protein